MSRHRSLAALTALVSMLSVAACAATASPALAPVAKAPPPPPAPRGPDPARFHVLMINGGGNPAINYQPHLLHLRALREVLVASGVHPDQISVFTSDGSDPAPDLVVRDAQPESDFWMLRDTRLARPLETPRRLVSSQIPDARLEAATKDGLKRWFGAEAKLLGPGDTLLVYVTDHGNRTGPDPMTNTIMLWGNEQISVTEFRELLHALPAGVRVVSLMSQCFSGAFAGLSTGAGEPARDVCGYFSSTADRMAYGCFAENVGKERVGHSFHFIRALASSRSMESAHAEVLVADDTPDVPLRSSDVFLDDLLRKAAAERSVSVSAFADGLLGAAWRDQPAWRDERSLAEHIAAAYGLQPPQSLADLETVHGELAQLEHRFDGSARAWRGALSDATGDNLQGFLAANPAWNERLSDGALKSLDEAATRSLSTSLLGELVPWTHKDKGDRLETLAHNSDLVEAAGYRSEVRVAVALRLRVLLMSLAGRAYLEQLGSPAERDRFAALQACEDVSLPARVAPAPPPAEPGAPAASLPSIADDEKVERDARPSWIGIVFNAIRDDLRKERGLPDGASLVTAVNPASPAKEGGLETGDVILGPPSKPFTAHNQIRAWTMLSPADQPGTIEILRGAKRMEITLVPRLLPTDVAPPPPPVAPAVGTPAPALSLRRYRGADVNLKDGKSHLILFWATWCGPCKASLPEVLAFERQRHTQVVAITNESKTTLDAFFKTWKGAFPRTIGIDDWGTDFAAYAVSVTPGFVLIDEKGIVRARGAGYSRPDGLQIDGWKWDGK